MFFRMIALALVQFILARGARPNPTQDALAPRLELMVAGQLKRTATFSVNSEATSLLNQTLNEGDRVPAPSAASPKPNEITSVTHPPRCDATICKKVANLAPEAPANSGNAEYQIQEGQMQILRSCCSIDDLLQLKSVPEGSGKSAELAHMIANTSAEACCRRLAVDFTDPTFASKEMQGVLLNSTGNLTWLLQRVALVIANREGNQKDSKLAEEAATTLSAAVRGAEDGSDLQRWCLGLLGELVTNPLVNTGGENTEKAIATFATILYNDKGLLAAEGAIGAKVGMRKAAAGILGEIAKEHQWGLTRTRQLRIRDKALRILFDVVKDKNGHVKVREGVFKDLLKALDAILERQARVGRYRIVRHTRLTRSKHLKSETLKTLPVGTEVMIEEVAIFPKEGRVRGRAKSPSGWITLELSGFSSARKTEEASDHICLPCVESALKPIVLDSTEPLCIRSAAAGVLSRVRGDVIINTIDDQAKLAEDVEERKVWWARVCGLGFAGLVVLAFAAVYIVVVYQRYQQALHGLEEAEDDMRKLIEAIEMFKRAVPWWMPTRALEAAQERAHALERHYTDPKALIKAVAGGDTKLLRGSHLKKEVRLKRRQDLPQEEAFWDVEADGLADKLDKRRVEVHAASYCWGTPEHPDPSGATLKVFQRAMAIRMKTMELLMDLAVFIDFCCVFQRGLAGEPRTPEEEEVFKRALKNMNLWYGHQDTFVWLLTIVFYETQPYHKRGWTTFECVVSGLIKDSSKVVDLGLLGDGQTFPAETNAWSVLRAERKPPTTPDQFQMLIAKKKFTNGADRSFVMGLYKKTYDEVFGHTEELCFVQVDWKDEDAIMLALSLPACSRLERLYLKTNKVTAEGAERLVEAAVIHPSIKEIDLQENPIAEDAIPKMLEQWCTSKAGGELRKADNLKFTTTTPEATARPKAVTKQKTAA